jgi:hypothetical protein
MLQTTSWSSSLAVAGGASNEGGSCAPDNPTSVSGGATGISQSFGTEDASGDVTIDTWDSVRVTQAERTATTSVERLGRGSLTGEEIAALVGGES